MEKASVTNFESSMFDNMNISRQIYYIGVFRVLGDVTLLVTVFGLLFYIWKKKSSIGISLRSQVLFAMVFVTRYADLFTKQDITYTTFVGDHCSMATIFIILTMYFIYRDCERELYDTFRCEKLIIGAAVISFLVNYVFCTFTPEMILETFSKFLEAVAIIPQLYLVYKAGKSEKVVDYYVYGLAQYRCFYFVQWTYLYYNEKYYDFFSIIASVVQVFFYLDYFFNLFSSIIISKFEDELSESDGRDPIYLISHNDIPQKPELTVNVPSDESNPIEMVDDPPPEYSSLLDAASNMPPETSISGENSSDKCDSDDVGNSLCTNDNIQATDIQDASVSSSSEESCLMESTEKHSGKETVNIMHYEKADGKTNLHSDDQDSKQKENGQSDRS